MDAGIVISKADGRPMYLQIMEQIKERVASGDWPRGHEIPSIRELAVLLSVSVITVKRAYLELEREGVIVTQHGKNSTVADDPQVRARLSAEDLADQLERVIRLGERLGLSREELAARLRQVGAQVTEEPS